MPQAPKPNARQESKEIQKAIDKEHKRNRGVMSCAECRRLKLKCDKTIPCSSCKRRGCSAICPNGKLATGQGTRFVLADTEKLHEKILLMSDRIRQLEDALAALQSSVAPSDPHPLLRRDLLAVKSIIDLHVAINEHKAQMADADRADDYSQYIEAFGTLALRDDGTATFYGRSAGSESLLIGEPIVHTTLSTSSDDKGPSPKDLPGPIKHLSDTFPFAPVFTNTVDLNYLVQNHLPPWQRARQLCELYLSQAWFFCAITKRQLLEECLPLWYSEASDLLVPGPAAPSSAQPNLTEPRAKTSHELALLFVIFCFGALTDYSLPPAPDNEEANMYCHLTRAALDLEPVLDRPPSITTVQTLALLAIYQGLVSGENSVECTWGIFGLATKLAQSIGLHRDCARWQLPSSEVQKRRALFWELFITDGWQSLATGRLATFYLPFVDCGLPNDPEPTIDGDGSVLPSFPAWKARFGYECMSAVIQNAQTANVPKYSVIIELDHKVRDMELPKYAQRPPVASAGLAEAMQHYMPLNYRNFILIYIHRCFFAEAVSNSPANPMQSQFALSFLAGYRSACEILRNLRVQFDLFPTQIARFWVLWTHAFSSSVMVASIVTHAAGAGARSKITGAAMSELRRAVDLFREASKYGGRAVKFLPILERLLRKAEQSYDTAEPCVIRHRDIFSPSTEPRPNDELSIFSGRTNTVNTRASSSPVSVSQGVDVSICHPPHLPGGLSLSPLSAPVAPANPPVPSSVALHPTLRNHWINFEADLDAQLTNARQDEYYTDADAPMEELHGPDASHTSHPHSHPPLVQQTKERRLHPLTIPPSEYRSSVSHMETSPAVSGYGTNQSQGIVGYPSTSSQAHSPSHHHPSTHQHYQRDALASASSQGSTREYGHTAADPRFVPYAPPTYHHPQPHQQHQSLDRPTRQHPYSPDAYSVTAAATMGPSRSAPLMPEYEDSPSAQVQQWDSPLRIYSEPLVDSTQLPSLYAQYAHDQNHYAYLEPSKSVGGPEPLQPQQQDHLQETWQSFGLYVSSRPC